MHNLNWFDGENILKSIREDSQRRRANPLEFFCNFLESIWRDNTAEEALMQWEIKVEQFPWYADDALYCINQVIERPPENLMEIIQEYGWLYLYHEDESGEVPFTKDEYRDWLKVLRDQYQLVYDNASIEE